ncbi:hypothetical protein [Candidatus Fukatsuia endosymbiont of Tuberolachnus salignus]|uniref:hypothetical protein n=1 Tax=Candidatus Fukatsuia endosymbiont of Tuberolachnus salignus TaxID=3077957 RepID=UPI00313DFAB3
MNSRNPINALSIDAIKKKITLEESSDTTALSLLDALTDEPIQKKAGNRFQMWA